MLRVFYLQTRKRFSQKRKSTLYKCIDICKRNEYTASQLKAILTPEAVHHKKAKTRKFSPRNYGKSRKSCNCCGENHPRLNVGADDEITSQANVRGVVTWLNESMDNSEILKDNYIIFRKDRSHNRAGGVLIAIKNAVFKSIREIPLPEQLQELEVVAASVTTSQDRKILFCSF